ncbi:unnamed protein product [Adineta ricciae]|uniref:Uncharacterized protein n=1 Tax=Adineta ricciae TaxID=249248 RepID=A0A814YLD7_ADIRI|nr:unnamed protein product [Adineta ricciae]CAF1440641.1 unnamed protein product [Adineta ricciae]
MTAATTTTTSMNTQQYYSTMQNQDDSLFYDDQIQRYDADTIKNRYGSNWKNFVSNVREIKQPDGSIVKEYIIDDPSVLQEIKPSPQTIDSTSSTTVSDDEQQTTKNKFAQIKAKFEQKNTAHVMASPSTSSANSSSTTSRQTSQQQMDDLYARHRRGSNEPMPNNDTIDSRSSSNRSVDSQNTYHRSQSMVSEQSKISSYRRFDSVDEADEEVRRIHRQGEELRRHTQDSTPISTIQEPSLQTRVQYEIVDEEGNPMAADGVQDLIKMAGVRAREVPQPDGTVVKEYVIDDPELVSRFRSHQQPHPQYSPVTPYSQQQQQQQPRVTREDVPPPPPRMPLRPPLLLRSGTSSVNENLPNNIQQIHVLEPQRKYEYLTTAGRRVQFVITNFDNMHGQPINDAEIRELTNAINTRLLPTSSPASNSFVQHQQPRQYSPPKPWQPAVDITPRPRLGSDHQQYASHANMAHQPNQSNLYRSASYGALNQASYPIQSPPQQQQQQQSYREPNYPSTTHRYQQQASNEMFQTAAQFLPNQQISNSSSVNPNQRPVYYPQSANYPFQGQQQHGVRIIHDNNTNNNNNTFIQQRTAAFPNGHTRI